MNAPSASRQCNSNVYVLDRLSGLHGDSHTRHVHAFQVTLGKDARLSIGWWRRGKAHRPGASSSSALPATVASCRAFLSTSKLGMVFVNHLGEAGSCRLDNNLQLKEGTVIRCCKNRTTEYLEWLVDGSLVASTSRQLKYGAVTMDGTVIRFGWAAINDCEMIPCVSVEQGACRFESIELED